MIGITVTLYDSKNPPTMGVGNVDKNQWSSTRQASTTYLRSTTWLDQISLSSKKQQNVS